MRSPGARPSSAFVSRTSYGMVIAGMNPLISPCFTMTVLRFGSSDSICPFSANRRSFERSQAAKTAKMAKAAKYLLARIGNSLQSTKVDEPRTTNGYDLGWHVRLQLPRVEGQLL